MSLLRTNIVFRMPTRKLLSILRAKKNQSLSCTHLMMFPIYNLNVSSCDVEASRMGHCGSDSRGVLVSLRKKQGKRRSRHRMLQ